MTLASPAGWGEACVYVEHGRGKPRPYEDSNCEH